VPGQGRRLPLEPSRRASFVANSYRRLHAKGVVDDAELNERARHGDGAQGRQTATRTPVGTAPALQLRKTGTTVFLLPGVPAEDAALLHRHVRR
jgi:nicotinamide-nucleotide amidase